MKSSLHVLILAKMGPTFRCEIACGETSHTAKSWASASGPVGYVDRMLDKMGTMLYSLILKWVAIARRGCSF